MALSAIASVTRKIGNFYIFKVANFPDFCLFYEHVRILTQMYVLSFRRDTVVVSRYGDNEILKPFVQYAHDIYARVFVRKSYPWQVLGYFHVSVYLAEYRIYHPRRSYFYIPWRVSGEA